MRSRVAWIAGAALGAAGVAYRSLRRVRVPEPAADPRADELRRKLDDSKQLVDERDEFEAGETRVDEVETTTVEEKRAAVHDRARNTVEQMRDPNS